MDSLKDFLSSHAKGLTIGAGVVCLSLIALKKCKQPRARICGIDYPKDVVIVHAFHRTKTIPNLGHLAMKLETYLRMTNIPYRVVFSKLTEKSPKNKLPWIEYNGLTMGDSQLIIEYLNKEFSVNVNRHLTTVEESQAWAIQKWLEEFTYWLNVYTRWCIFFPDMFSKILGLSDCDNFVMTHTFAPKIRKVLCICGVGRHSNDEVHEMMKNDIRHFANLLGKKPYLMGDKMSLVDCAAFGILSEVRWATPDKCPGRKLLLAQKNVMEYLDRIKKTYWPDWDSLEYSNKFYGF